MSTHEERMSRIAEHFENITEDEIEENLLKAGLGKIKSSTDFGYELRNVTKNLNVHYETKNISERNILMEYKIGEPVGILWEPHDREFEVHDIREIHYRLSGDTIIEYQLARIGKPEFRSNWLPASKLFKLI